MPMMPKKQPIANPVSEFCDQLLTDRFKNAPEAHLLHLIVVNGANADPNGVLNLLADLYNEIGEFITRMNDGEFSEWMPPGAMPASDVTIDIPHETDESVLELP